METLIYKPHDLLMGALALAFSLHISDLLVALAISLTVFRCVDMLLALALACSLGISALPACCWMWRGGARLHAVALGSEMCC